MPAVPVVVVIEDHPELSEVLRDVLTEEGYDVLSVRDQFAAVATLRSRAVDLVISDLPEPESGQPHPVSEIARDHADVPLVHVADASTDDVPFLGPWMKSDDRYVLRRPFKLADLLELCRKITDEVGRPAPNPPSTARDA